MSSSERRVVISPRAPKANPTYSPAVVHNGIVYCSGSVGTDPKTMTVVQGTIGDRTIQALTNLVNVLEAAGSCKENILKVNIYVTNMNDVPTMNEAYNKFFAEPRPARATVAVAALARGTDVEIECTAFISRDKLAKL
ncbi:hypothetical protein AYO21_04311 [Fonsecaea monophora]|uniref:Uncharacterized protein n=1 Tax=Fonsecaea monophora TaxID=254056 RepID=A0A177FDV5_9EURO|nr:hypothetical protein AYO21_04311 [Fonsecaea monophora]OAG41369.1 hypothetical protein AYO21_04311 [Fonsecaea monophora]